MGQASRATTGRTYRPPTDVVESTVGALLGEARVIPKEQQARFGFSAAERQGQRVWCSGDLSLVQRPCVAIVGTRKVSSEGAARARRLARELVAQGVVVVSGLATGVDTEAMQAAIAANGKAVGVIGTPIDKAYPAANAGLQEIIYTHHLLVSQFASGSRVYKGNFPTRNKLMAALSARTCPVGERSEHSQGHQATTTPVSPG
jgi:DNA processing protein